MHHLQASISVIVVLLQELAAKYNLIVVPYQCSNQGSVVVSPLRTLDPPPFYTQKISQMNG